MNKQSEVTKQTKKNLMDAFWLIYKEKRIEKITIKDITSTAGYNRGTFYEYFTDVYDVLEQLEDMILPSIEELPPLKVVDMTNQLSGIVELYHIRKEYYNVLLGDNGDPAFLSKMKNRIKPMLLEYIGKVPKEQMNALDYGLEYVLSAMIGVLSYWFRQENPIPIEELVSIIFSLSHNHLLEEMLIKTDSNR